MRYIAAGVVYGMLFALAAVLVWFGIVLHHTPIHCIRGAHPAVVLEACERVQK